MPTVRRARIIASLVLAWFVMSLGVAVASPVVKPQAMQLVCTSAGAFRMIVLADDGTQALQAGAMDCPLCALGGAPPPVPQPARVPSVQPLAVAVRSIPAARIAAATAAPLPARGPPRCV